ncbi:LysR family transcriptional regulator [Paenibacillus sp. LMG 31456]|uniref:LysR family transcriptional regulator n=1 Tax=Paenibacillus foliorum TaxID=2654974 RepID=A0A972GZL5_9BACL|nr:LysR family transcriptional regulator [Paenibacillus foliorum]NOU97053.1 LysR family transcriptional regulator [Paenibacillus foliorum]
MIDQIEGKWFKSFAAVYEHKSISKAAEQLGYVQSTLTTHIQLLERACGRKLFNRLPRGVEPTEAGVELSHYANQFLQLGEAMNEALQSHTVAKGTVKLQVLESFCVSYMPSVFELFFEQFPLVQLELTTGFYKDTLEALLERRIHMGIVPKNPERDDIDFHPLIAEELIFIAAPALSGQLGAVGLSEERRVIGFGSRCIYQSLAHEAMMQEWGTQPYKSLEYASLEMIKQTVMSGQGIALVPKIAVEAELQSGRLVRVQMKNPIFVTHGIIAWKDKEETAATKALKQTILNRF